MINSKLEEELCGQKANIKWMKAGDYNTKFFPSSVKAKGQKIFIHKIKDGSGKLLEDKAKIVNEAITHFQMQLTGSHISEESALLHHIPAQISEENRALTAVPLMEEVHSVVSTMNGSSVAGADGFNF